jgi:hypothetical protein
VLGEELHVVQTSDKRSHLLMKVGDKGGFVYQNKAEVQSYVVAAISRGCTGKPRVVH